MLSCTFLAFSPDGVRVVRGGFESLRVARRLQFGRVLGLHGAMHGVVPRRVLVRRRVPGMHGAGAEECAQICII